MVLDIPRPQTPTLSPPRPGPGVIITDRALKSRHYPLWSAPPYHHHRPPQETENENKLTTTTLSNVMNLQRPRIIRQGETQVVPDLVGEVEAGGVARLVAAVGDPGGEGCDLGAEACVLVRAGRGASDLVGRVGGRGRGGGGGEEGEDGEVHFGGGQGRMFCGPG